MGYPTKQLLRRSLRILDRFPGKVWPDLAVLEAGHSEQGAGLEAGMAGLEGSRQGLEGGMGLLLRHDVIVERRSGIDELQGPHSAARAAGEHWATP